MGYVRKRKEGSERSEGRWEGGLEGSRAQLLLGRVVLSALQISEGVRPGLEGGGVGVRGGGQCLLPCMLTWSLRLTSCMGKPPA